VFEILIPPLEEQNEIVDYLDNEILEIEQMINKKEQFLMEVEFYKKSMIYEYITGKKEAI
jgi:type I restriction enzyme S subunit